ncbi:MAG: MATE family efflux transporter [Desulfobacterales bacterium]|nr:MATE family efflux transporter [Desulfobacterales bacterium]
MDASSRSERRALNRDILTLALPVFIAQGINSLACFVGQVMLSQLGPQAFNGINAGMLVFLPIVTLVAAAAVGSTTLIAQNWGRGNKRRADQILQQSLMVGFMISVAILVLGICTRNALFRLLGMDPATAALGSEYLLWLYLGVPFIAPGFFLAASLRGTGDTQTPMYASFVMAASTLVLSYGLILGKLGLPRWEGMGAALAIDISFCAFTGIMVLFVLAKKTNLTLLNKGWWPDMATCRSIFRIGLPSAAEWLSIQLGVLLYIPVITRYGQEALAGFFAGMAVISLAQALTMGFQTAANTLVGQMVGAKNFPQAESVFHRGAIMGCLVLAAFGTFAFLFALSPAFSLFFEDLNSDSLAYGRVHIVILALTMPLMGISFSIAGGLRGAGNTVLPLIASTIGVYGGRISLAFGVYYLFHPPVYVVWCSMFPDLIARIAIMAFGLRSGRWKTIELKL